MQYTRKEIIAYLRKYHSATIPELSKALNLTVGNIRHHINDLEGQGAVESTGDLPVKGRGRPTRVYTLAVRVLDHNLDGLAETLMKVLFQKPKENQVYEAIAKEMTAGFQGDASPVQKLNRIIQWLNEHNYQARWEASPTGPRIILDHCPYTAIRDTNPKLCQVDQALLTQLTGKPMRQDSKRNDSLSGSQHCSFTETVSSFREEMEP